MKIAIIGAGSIVFTKNLVGDILRVEELGNVSFALCDIDAVRLDNSKKMVETMIAQLGAKASVQASVDRRDILPDADFVVLTFQVGALAAYEIDLMLPLKKYGLDQCVGDTIGVGGVFRALRTIPVLVDIARDMEALCPSAYLLNYVNPMSMNIMALYQSTDIPLVGLCHSVQGTSEELAKYIGAPIDEITYEVAGINHSAWFLKYEWNGKDAYPLIRAQYGGKYYVDDMIKFEMLKYFGYFVTESSYHFSEYAPYFRQYPDILERINQMGWMKPYGGSCLELVKDRQEGFYAKLQKQINREEPMQIERSNEYCSRIIEAIALNRPAKIYGNVKNTGLITNLPEGCCVEVPVMVDANGFTPGYIGALPMQLAGLNRTHVSVHELAVYAALNGDRDAAMRAVALDPYTAAVLPLPKIEQMCKDLFEAERDYLPQFA